jgi:hypothetical protein
MLDLFGIIGRCPCLVRVRDSLAAVAIGFIDFLHHIVHEPVPPGVPLCGLGHAVHRTQAINELGQLIFQRSNVMTHGVCRISQ